MNWILIVVPAVFLLALITVADNWDRFRKFHDELGGVWGKFTSRLFYLAVFFSLVFVTSQALSFIGFNFNLAEKIVMALITSTSLVLSKELKEAIGR